MSNPGKRSGPRGTVRGSGGGAGLVPSRSGSRRAGHGRASRLGAFGCFGRALRRAGAVRPRIATSGHRGFGRGALLWRWPRVTRCDPAHWLCAFVCPAAPPRPAHKAALRAQRRRLRSPRLPEPRNAPQCPAPHPAPGALRGGRRRSSGCCRRSVWERSANRRRRCCRRGFPAPIAGASEQK